MKLSKVEAGKLGALASINVIKEKVNKRKDLYYLNPKKCINCNSTITYELKINKFCSKSCSVTYNNNNNHWRGPDRKYSISCQFCGNSIKNEGTIYCSTKCHNDEKRKKLFLDFENGLASSRVARNIMIERYGRKCMQCEWGEINPISNKCPIELEHSDGNSKNNIPSNLKLLCPNCHSLTPTYKGLNRGNGRHSRMNRYRDGKSF